MMETNTVGKIFVPVPEPGYYPLTTTGQITGVWINPDEDVEWTKQMINGYEIITGYTIAATFFRPLDVFVMCRF